VVDKTGALRQPQQGIDPDPDQLPAFSEFALASAFAEGPGKDWRYTAAWLEWAKWSGVRWVPDEVKHITWEVRECCTATMNSHLADSTPLQRMRLTTLKTVNAVITLAGSDPGIATAAAQWDADPMLLGTPAGVVDLSTGLLIAATQAQMISRSTGVAPVAGDHPWWDRVLERAGAGMSGFLQLWCGYMLTGDTREERFLFIHGPGGGGKSKFMLVLSEILGDYRRTTKMESFTAQNRQEHSEEIARLAGARLVIATETDEGSRWNEARIKALTGRDAIAARHMHKSTFEFKPQFKLVFVGNHRPALRSVGEEMRRRIDLVEWGGTIPEAERILDLPDRLRAEYPAILAWMIEGCIKWQRQGLGKPPAVIASVAEYLQGEDTLGAWLEECVELRQGDRVLSGEAYHSFRRWADAQGEFIPSQKRFTQRLRDRGIQSIKSGSRYFQGIRLKVTDAEVREIVGWTPD
jgi:putative DNA primase/helicase